LNTTPNRILQIALFYQLSFNFRQPKSCGKFKLPTISCQLNDIMFEENFNLKRWFYNIFSLRFSSALQPILWSSNYTTCKNLILMCKNETNSCKTTKSGFCFLTIDPWSQSEPILKCLYKLIHRTLIIFLVDALFFIYVIIKNRLVVSYSPQNHFYFC
jgi:hypothetical protein